MHCMKSNPVNVKTIFLLSFLSIFACVSLRNVESIGESKSSFSYIPVDPLPIIQAPGSNCPGTGKCDYFDLLSSLPNQAVRFAVGESNSSGTVTFGPSTIGIEGRSYEVILDYISVDMAILPVYVKAFVKEGLAIIDSASIYNGKIRGIEQNNKTIFYEISPAERQSPYSNYPILIKVRDDGSDLVNIPIYIGVGLRLKANVFVKKGKVNLSSLGALSAEAESGNITGYLVIQTLGITGNNVNKILPLPSEINETTIQNSILSLGSIKAILYDQSTIITPQVVGLINPIGGGQTVVNSLIHQISGRPPVWYRPCK